MNERFSKLVSLIEKHDTWMENTINLVASENKLSPLVRNSLTSDFGNRVAEGWLGERIFPGLKYYDEIESYGMELVRTMFNADFADLRPISGTCANMVVYTAFTSPGDTVVAPSISAGGHISMSGATPKKVFRLNVVNLPFSPDEFNIKIDESIELIKKVKPKLVILGGSVLLFRQPVKHLAAVAKSVGSIVLYDASHVAGLIAAKCFPNPLLEGADIMTMSTCKTIPGPQHAFILCNNEFSEKIRRTTFPSLVSGHHLHETVASILAMEEFRVFGKAYALQVLKNSRSLAKNLSDSGFNVMAKHLGFTETHMFLVDISDVMPAIEAENLLEAANIIVNRNMLPNDQSFSMPNGLRFGTPEITRIGMCEKEMNEIAKFICQVLIERISPDKVRKQVIELRRKFNKIQYCFQP